VSRGMPRRALHAWALAGAVVALIAGPILLYELLPWAGIPTATAAGLAAIVALKHLGVLAVVLTPIYALFRRRSRR
jgi:hypothetical protein